MNEDKLKRLKIKEINVSEMFLDSEAVVLSVIPFLDATDLRYYLAINRRMHDNYDNDEQSQGVDDEGLLDFYVSYFDRHAMYTDDKWQLYHAMGGRKISMWALFKAVLVAKPRWNRKGIPSSDVSPLRSDPWMTGGVLVFDQKGSLVYAMEETVGEEFNMQRLERAIQAARHMNAMNNNEEEEEEDRTTNPPSSVDGDSTTR